MLSRNQGNCSILVGQDLKQCEVMLQLKQFRFEVYRNDYNCYFFTASEVIEPCKTRGYVTSFSKLMQQDEFYYLTSSLPTSATKEDRCFELLRCSMLVPTSGPTGRMNNKGNLALSFEAMQNCSYLLAKVSRRICNTLYIIEVVAELEEEHETTDEVVEMLDKSIVPASQPRGECEVVLRFKLYDPLSCIILQTASPMTLDRSLEGRREQVYGALERLHVVESSEGRAAVLRYTRAVMKVMLSEAPHSAPCSSRGHFLPLTIGLSCREGKTRPLLLVHACSEGESCLDEGSSFLFHPLVLLPPLGARHGPLAYIDDASAQRTEFEELYAVLDHLCVVVDALVKHNGKQRDWQLWHPAQSHDVRVSHLSRRVQSARALDYSLNQKSASDIDAII